MAITTKRASGKTDRALLREGAGQAVVNCMKITPKDTVVIIGDSKSKSISEVLGAECSQITQKISLFNLDDFGERPLAALPKDVTIALEESTATFYTAGSYKGELASVRRPMIRLATKTGREGHMIDITEGIMKTGMRADYAKIKEVTQAVFNIVKNAKEIRVTTDLGTNLIATFNPDWKWIPCDGDILNMPTRWSNLPDGEVFTCPLTLNGIAMVDGSIGDYFESYNPVKSPIKLRISDTRVISLENDNKVLEKELNDYIKTDENANRIGEFAIGTNIGLKEFIGIMLQDEKFPGVHIAVGDSYQGHTGAPFPSKVHCDFVIGKTTIKVDGVTIMEKGHFLHIPISP
jgi:leucyl aminopeptidase (aminopeptidase T)